MSSRFFHGDSSSESSSSEGEELYSEEEEDEEQEESEEDEEDEESDESSSDEEGAKGIGAKRFFKTEGSESGASSDEETTKVVKSAKDKRLEELEATVKQIENGEKINDWGLISAGAQMPVSTK
jgi:translation initiation factor 3 subunit C